LGGKVTALDNGLTNVSLTTTQGKPVSKAAANALGVTATIGGRKRSRKNRKNRKNRKGSRKNRSRRNNY
jgi:hypothetical protein